ncbi:MAG: alpha/beta hydrolase [Nocardioides sp.]|nr:alpha/beta hydrolase [Nocardioidaceae bacterium]MCB8957631.1 alpha/beta hydrolase [Nocardioides sp.]
MPSRSPSPRVREWAERGSSVRWRSTTPENAGRPEVAVHVQTRGDRANPALVLVHGYPTSSYDFHRVVTLLEDDHFLCLVDLPGYGLSDKPCGDHRYTIADDARLLDELVRTTFGLDRFTLVTHDRGDSVGLAFLDRARREGAPYDVTGLVVLNGNVWLPLAQLTRIQKALLNDVTGPPLSRLLPTRAFARGLARRTCTPPLDVEETAAIEGMLAHQDGMRVQHQLIQYLRERRVHESSWLESLASGPVPVAVVWGELDTIAPPRVADFVWEQHLRDRAAPSAYWRVPGANHYPQLDQPGVVAELLRAMPWTDPGRTVAGARLVAAHG